MCLKYNYQNNIIKSTWNYTFHSIIVGSMLGDLHAERRNNTTRLTFQISHIPYSQFIYLIYNHYTYCTIPKIQTQTKNNTQYHSVRFKTKSSTCFNTVHDYFYVQKQKILPHDIHLYLSPIALAIWFMDDGSKCGSGIRIATYKYTIQDVQRLCHILKTLYNIKATPQKCGSSPKRRQQRVLYISASSVPTFYNIIKPYIIPSMLYKIPQ